MSFKQIGRYEIKREIGRGGMATVYLGHDPSFQRDVAIKLLPPQFSHDPTFHERFQNEARTIAALEHNAVVPVYDYGEEGDWPYLVMRYMSGGSLADRLRSGPLSLDEAAGVTRRIAAALDKAHKQNFIHRDLKPGNILFDEENYAYLADFGIVRLVESTHTVTMIGTPDYMTPEQIRGLKIDHRSDIYQLGILLYEMLAGQKPFTANDTAALMYKHAHEPVPDIREKNKDLPEGCEEVIRRAMAKEPNGRYDSAGEMAAALTRYLTETHSPTIMPESLKKPDLEPPPVSAPEEPIVVAEEPSLIMPVEEQHMTPKEKPPVEAKETPPVMPDNGPRVVPATIVHKFSRTKPKKQFKQEKKPTSDTPTKPASVPWIRWLLSSFIGFGLGFASLFPLYGTWYVDNVVAGAIFGTILGFVQWLVLRKRVKAAFWWVLLNMAAFAVFFIVSDLGNSGLPAFFIMAFLALFLIVIGVVWMRRSLKTL